MSTSNNVIEFGGQKKTLRAYVTGLFLCLLLTVMAFVITAEKLLSERYLYISLAGLAVIQLYVQAVCFLNLNGSKDGRWNLLPFLFTIFIICILAGGSLWIMYNLDYNMMH